MEKAFGKPLTFQVAAHLRKQALNSLAHDSAGPRFDQTALAPPGARVFVTSLSAMEKER